MRVTTFSLVAAVALASAAWIAMPLPSHAGDDKPAAPSIAIVKFPGSPGATLEGSLHKPGKPGPYGAVAVVLASGHGGGRDRPVRKWTGEALASAGFTVLRFDWAFFTAGRKSPSESLSAEVADLEGAIAFAKRQPGVSKVILSGKSLGTMAAAKRLETKSDDLTALLLLTLPLTQGDDAGTAREGMDSLLHTKLPTLIVVGDHDPLCPLPVLYDFAAKCDAKPRIVVVPGDHGLSKGNGDESETEENVALGAAAAALWARRFAGS
jgi:predicted alpha/beta-hydrolase family hydrolase